MKDEDFDEEVFFEEEEEESEEDSWLDDDEVSAAEYGMMVGEKAAKRLKKDISEEDFEEY